MTEPDNAMHIDGAANVLAQSITSKNIVCSGASASLLVMALTLARDEYAKMASAPAIPVRTTQAFGRYAADLTDLLERIDTVERVMFEF